MLNNQEFFDELSVQYDSMIPFERTKERKKKLFKNLLNSNYKSIADIGCGTGSDSLALTELGYIVTSFDPSAQMLNKAQLNAKSCGLKLDSYQYRASQIPNNFNAKYDAVISFGNSFANIPRNEFESSVHKCFSLLKDKGELYIQILNYEKILSEKKRIVSITTSKEKYFVRFYDFIEKKVVFNVLQFDKTNPADHQLLSSEIYPYSADDYTTALKKAGFRSNKFYGNLNLKTFDAQASNDLIIIASK